MLLRFVYFCVAIETAWAMVCVATAPPLKLSAEPHPGCARRTRVFACQSSHRSSRGQDGARPMGVALKPACRRSFVGRCPTRWL